ncbi:Pycsar system effector family protein [Streptomyces chitinivorans]|uniref:Pycsar system effector family protein n=1 Tax=Streptomyces chitinivorans TaxID=1257027 RepID=A0ABW7HU01_9ACTN|nr:Pycsar system effector family protein [Streptomyces chitinivorans]MDH2410391.1 DUF5706 domain-containing protein [Streptomyces chitinivorans]
MSTTGEPATDAPPTGREQAVYVAERLLATAREDLARADTKAAVLLSGAFAAPVLLLGAEVWTPSSVTGAMKVLLLAGGTLWAVGTALLAWVVLPRTGTARPGPGMTFFKDIVVAPPDTERLVQAITAAARDRVSWLTVQLVDVSLILDSKYRWLRWGTCCLAAGLMLCGAALTGSG